MSAHHLRNTLLASLGLLAACGGETVGKPAASTGSGGGTGGGRAGEGGTSAGDGGPGAGNSGTSGTGAGTSGTSAGKSGTSAGKSGTSAGNGGTTAGNGGTTAGKGGTTATAGAAGSAGGAGHAEFACGSPKPSASYRGVQVCDRGGSRRTEAVACPTTPLGLTGGNDFLCTPTQPEQRHECAHNADCTAKPFGFCSIDNLLSFTYGCACEYGCLQDDDCGAGFACLCGLTVGRCVAATCRTNADCASGACRVGESACGSVSLSCASPMDACDGPLDCNGFQCESGGNGFRCGHGCSAGRPLFRDGTPVVARLLSHGAWC